MKAHSFTLGVLLVSASSSSTFPTQADPDQPPPAELRERVEQLTEKARDLKAAGRHEDALRVMREAEELEVQARARRETSEIEGRRGEPRAAREAVRDGERERQTAAVQERLAERRREVDRPGPGRVDRPRAERADEPGPVPPRREGMDRRMRHFELAIENLHAAGLHELAERLAREREQVAERLRTGPERNAAVQEELERVRAELNELREGMQRLKARLEELHRDEPRR